MSRWSRKPLCTVVFILLPGSFLYSQAVKVVKTPAPAKEAVKKGAPTAPTHKVKRGPFKVEVSLKGAFEASRTTEVSLRPREWAELTVLEAVEQGTRVEKGDRLVLLETRKIDNAIEDLESSRELSLLSRQEAREELDYLEKTLPMDLAAAERQKKEAGEDLLQFIQIDRPLSEKSAEFSVKSSRQSLENAREELRQLEKMYEADDLTEETEEIVLKRQRAAVERYAYYLERSEISRDQILKTQLPRQEQGLKESTRRQSLALKKTLDGARLSLERKKLELRKLDVDRTRADEKLARLKEDRESLVVRAPAGGIVYYGKSVRGNWTGGAALEAKLLRGGRLTANEVFMTIVQPRPLTVRATVPEKELHAIRPGLRGKAVPVGFPDVKIPARVKSVSPIPVTPGSFEAVLHLDLDDGVEQLMPGMTCTVEFVPYLKKKALTVPAGAVFEDELDSDAHHVFVSTPEGHRKQPVKVGKRCSDRAEILEGLEADDVILLEKPKESE